MRNALFRSNLHFAVVTLAALVPFTLAAPASAEEFDDSDAERPGDSDSDSGDSNNDRDSGGDSGGDSSGDSGGDSGVNAPAAERPQVRSIGIGFGFDVPGDLTEPDILSVRFRLSPTWTVEPVAGLAIGSVSQKFDTGGSTTENAVGSTSVAAGVTARKHVGARGKIDFQLLGSALLGYGSSEDNPAGSDNNVVTSTLALTAGWGFGLECFFKPQWSVSFDAMNPAVVFNSVTTNPPGDGEGVETTLLVGAIFDPTVRVMTHVYW